MAGTDVFKNISLIGMMGSGKTTVGQVLAARLGWRFVDLDRLIEMQTGISIPQIFTRYGEDYFRHLEEDIACNVLRESRQVIATGGGTVTSQRVRRKLVANSLVVWLMASPKELARRTAQTPGTRPLLMGRDLVERLEEILAQREQYYQIAHLRINTEGVPPEHVTDSILQSIARLPDTYLGKGTDFGGHPRNSVG